MLNLIKTSKSILFSDEGYKGKKQINLTPNFTVLFKVRVISSKKQIYSMHEHSNPQRYFEHLMDRRFLTDEIDLITGDTNKTLTSRLNTK